MSAARARKKKQSSLEESSQNLQRFMMQCRQRSEEQSTDFFQVSALAPTFSKHFWPDLWAQLFNCFYAPIYVVLMDFSFWLEEMGYPQGRQLFKKMPLHLKTGLQKEIEGFLLNNIFEVQKVENTRFRNHVTKVIKHFNSRRNEKTDLNVSYVSLIFGFLFFKNHNFSLRQISVDLATYWANKEASSDFFLGRGVGSVFYSIFPEEPSFWQLCLTGTLVLLGFSFFIYLFHFAMFLLQIHFGLYKRRIDAFINRVEKEILMDFVNLQQKL